MERLLVLNLGNGNSTVGLPSVIAQLWQDGSAQPMQVSGSLPAMPEIDRLMQQWQQLYFALYQHLGWRQVNAPALGFELEFEIDATDVTHISQAEFDRVCDRLKIQLNQWLNRDGFQQIQRQIRTYLSPDDQVRIVVTANDPSLLQLPWHLWQLLDDYPQAEVALSPAEYARSQQTLTAARSPQVRILAILGNSQGIDVNHDRQLLEQLPQTKIEWLIEPSSEQLQQQLWERSWDLLFFAGHSSSQGKGCIQLNATETLTIDQLKYGLKRAIANGLKLAIFNSCDGLGLAQDLADLRIPQVIVMRQPVPDRVAQAFLTTFLQTFSTGRSLYGAVREAREKLQLLERDFPCATWLPVICQNPAEPAARWADWCEPRPITPTQLRPKARSWVRSCLHVVACSALVTGLATGAKALGWTQSIEFASYDQLIRLRPIEPTDQRLLVVTITEADIQAQRDQIKSGSLADPSLLKLLQILNRAKPKAIGLDIYRDFATTLPALKAELENNDRLITVCKRPDRAHDPTGVAAAPEAPIDLVGFSDFVQDHDSVIRRHLIAMEPTSLNQCGSGNALSTLLAMRYFSDRGMPIGFKNHSLKIGPRWFHPLSAQSGIYPSQDVQMLQIMLNYRRTDPGIAQTVTLQQILDRQVPPAIIRDRIVLIGGVNASSNDRWATPFGLGFAQKQPGVLIHAQMVSQILSAVENNRPLIRPMPMGQAIAVIALGAIGGGIISYSRSPRLLLLLLGSSLITLWIIAWWALFQGWWMPIAIQTITLVGTSWLTNQSKVMKKKSILKSTTV
jgi:CHASE2 domain-containing sensor protein